MSWHRAPAPPCQASGIPPESASGAWGGREPRQSARRLPQPAKRRPPRRPALSDRWSADTRFGPSPCPAGFPPLQDSRRTDLIGPRLTPESIRGLYYFLSVKTTPESGTGWPGTGVVTRVAAGRASVSSNRPAPVNERPASSRRPGPCQRPSPCEAPSPRRGSRPPSRTPAHGQPASSASPGP